jgi:hypothetical protein
MKSQGDQWVLRHMNFDQHNHPPTPNPFSLQPHVSRRPGFAEAISVAKTHRGILTYSESKEVLKKMGLTIDPNRYYNLVRKEQSESLSPQEEAMMLLYYLESQSVHVVVDEQYVLDERGDKKDRVIMCIVWWTSAQIQLARRFVSDMVAETDATFNTNEKRLLLQCFVGIDNTNSTFEFLQAFSTAESARNIRFILQVLQDYFFYDCPGFAVLAGDFGTGLSAGFAQKAAEDAREAERQLAHKGKQKQVETVSDELQLECYPLPTARPEYEPDSQTIIVDTDWVRAVEPTVIGINQERVILQFCTWHGAEAIKRRLIAKGYTKERREDINNLIWKWIKAPDFDTLEEARDKLILSLNDNEKEYLVGWYQPKEPQFCHAYTRQYRNLGVHSTQRVEGNHPLLTANLHKNLKVSDAVFRICNRLESLIEDYEQRLSRSRISEPRLIDTTFFRLVLRRVTHYCLELCSSELLKAKELYDIDVLGGEEDDEFDPKFGCEQLCELPLRYRLPCKHWMLYFYRKNEPIPINLFHPRWLVDGPSILHKPWQIRLDNFDYTKGGDDISTEENTGDRSLGAGKQLIIDTTLAMIEKHQNLPPGEKETFALTFKKMSDSLAKNQDQKLERLTAIPRRLPDAIVQPKVTFVPGRKRALTGREAAELQEKEEARLRRRAQIAAEKQEQNDARQEQATALHSQLVATVAAEYVASQGSESHDIIDISSESDEFVDIDVLITQNQARSSSSTQPTTSSVVPSSSRRARERKPTTKQASQNRRIIEKEEKRLAKLARKPKTINTTQLDGFDLPFRSSQ